MNYVSNCVELSKQNNYQKLNKEELEEEIKSPIKWKNDAEVQLQYFLAACRLYNFCDANEVYNLLHK